MTSPSSVDQGATVRANLGLVSMVVNQGVGGRRFLPGTAEHEDDTQAGVIGLASAVATWDPAVARLSTWAVPAIRWAIQRDRANRWGSGFRRAQERAEWYRPPLSLDVMVDGSKRSLGDLIEDVPPERSGLSDEDLDLVDGILAGLTERERTMILHPASEAGAMLGIKPASVRRARVRIYARLRDQHAQPMSA